jgi:hypothetical protein
VSAFAAVGTLKVFFPRHVLSGFIRPASSERVFWWCWFIFTLALTLAALVVVGGRYLSIKHTLERGVFKTVEITRKT